LTNTQKNGNQHAAAVDKCGKNKHLLDVDKPDNYQKDTTIGNQLAAADSKKCGKNWQILNVGQILTANKTGNILMGENSISRLATAESWEKTVILNTQYQ